MLPAVVRTSFPLAIPWAEIKRRIEAGPCSNWCGPENTRVFDSTYPMVGYQSPTTGMLYFATGEVPPRQRREYTIRRLNPDASLTTLGRMGSHSSSRTAERTALAYALGDLPDTNPYRPFRS